MPAIERLAWTTAAWEGYLHWQSQDGRQLPCINQLIQACLRDLFAGIGKPEPLRENLAGCWSRRIDEEHGLVYQLDGELLVTLACPNGLIKTRSRIRLLMLLANAAVQRRRIGCRPLRPRVGWLLGPIAHTFLRLLDCHCLGQLVASIQNRLSRTIDSHQEVPALGHVQPVLNVTTQFL